MAQADEIPSEYYFITPPQDVSWSKGSQINDIQTYATNNPYIHYGTTQLRSLTLGNAMIEGFSDGKQVEQNVIDLESCMRIVLDTEDGYAAPFCWEVYAGGKKYGTFVIESVNIQEQIRDNDGMAARAMADVSLREVAPYQVNAGIDITAQAITGNLSEETQEQLLEQQKNNTESSKQDKKTEADKKKNDKNDPNKGDSTKKNENGDTVGDSLVNINSEVNRPGYYEE